MVRRRHACPECGRGGDGRGGITVLVVVLVFGLAYAQLATGAEEGSTIAPWAAGALTLVLQGYYMTKGAERQAEAIMRRMVRRRDTDPPAP